MNSPEEIGQISAARKAEIAQEAVRDHARALKELSDETPVASRTEADEAELGRLLLEGQGLRQEANRATADTLQVPPAEHVVDTVDGLLVTPRDQAKGVEHNITAGHIIE